MPYLQKDGTVKLAAVEKKDLEDAAGILRALAHLDEKVKEAAQIAQAVADGYMTQQGLKVPKKQPATPGTLSMDMGAGKGAKDGSGQKAG